MSKTNFVFLTVGKTTESKEAVEFKRYIGVGSSKVLAVNPDKQALDELMGFESQSDPVYTGTDDNGEFARIDFIVRTDAESCNGIEITNKLTFFLRNTPAYNRDKTKVQIIDDYGNSTWTTVEDAKAGNKPLSSNGNPLKIADKYRIAFQGEPELVDFLKIYLCVGDAFNYTNGAWVLKPDAADNVFGLEHIKDYFKGNFSELAEALKLQPNNKVKLLYGVRTSDDGKQYQTIAARRNMILRNTAGPKAFERLEEEIRNAKNAGSFATTEFKVQELAEYSVEPTDLSEANTQDSSNILPWD